MKNVKQEALLWVQLGGFVAIWAVVLYLTGTELAINWEAVKKLPDVVTVYVVLTFVFTKWLWKLPIFRGWLVPFPDLQGTWEGELKSTWTNPETGRVIAPIPAVVVVRQTFSSVSCTLFTEESESYSTAAQISLDEESGALHLNYNYTCAVKRRWSTAGESPARELGSLHPEAIGAAVEETKPSEPLV